MLRYLLHFCSHPGIFHPGRGPRDRNRFPSNRHPGAFGRTGQKKYPTSTVLAGGRATGMSGCVHCRYRVTSRRAGAPALTPHASTRNNRLLLSCQCLTCTIRSEGDANVHPRIGKPPWPSCRVSLRQVTHRPGFLASRPAGQLPEMPAADSRRS